MAFSFIETITKQLERPSLGEQKAPTLWPSAATATKDGEAVGKCRRQAFYRYVTDNYNFDEKFDSYKDLVQRLEENKEPVSNYMKWIWKAGDLYEQYCIDLAKEAGVFVATQVAIYIPKTNVSGKLDLVVINPETSNYQIVEVKSVYGFNANSVMGTDSQRRKGMMGEPRESHLMQLGIYQWWYGKPNGFDPGLLVYGARDTGKYSEYLVTIEQDEETQEDFIHYQGNAPVVTPKVNSGISMQNIMRNYKGLLDALESGEVPDRDYCLSYTPEMIDALYEKGLLTKTDTTQYEKRKAQLAEGKARVVKAVEKGDWQCRFCAYQKTCYEEPDESNAAQ
jgi:hypothetical protein